MNHTEYGCIDTIEKHLLGIAAVKREFLMSAGRARRNKRLAKKVSIVLGIMIAIVGIVLARVTDPNIHLPYTNIPLREFLSYASAFLGAAITFVNERFDPTKFREREVALGDSIYKLRGIEERAKLTLPRIASTDSCKAEEYLKELQTDEDILLEEAEELKAGVRVIFESGVASITTPLTRASHHAFPRRK
jgi:hypothetical protein